ncbi:hypothetical protein JOF29_006333 [Kribbella aluminosa]|uniref:Uncharacterized protein n=1 Tax=Kribbella aluminosa TaxID=416017 RepID=A0ABS4UUB2_9ACTN|nr:hypothetical protein [Kribbella aluminosa]MBP2355223.1 hypothetical protein [Kribbella aluminosa]
MPKLKLGAALYALLALVELVSAVLVYAAHGDYAQGEPWFLVVVASMLALIGVLLGVGAVTRRGLVADDGPWICRKGWIVVIGLTAATFAALMLSDTGTIRTFPNPAIVFLPNFVKRLQEKYYEGVEEAEREINAAEPDGERPTTG